MSRGGGTIVWLASYPGSGNTWLRAFLANLLRDADTPVSVNELTGIGHAGSRAWFDAYAGVEASDLSRREIDDLRPGVYEAIAAERKAPFFMKIHDALHTTAAGDVLVSTPATLGVLYIIRNPLDVAASYAHHRGTTIDDTIECMAEETHLLHEPAGGIELQLVQRLGSWSGHVLSWVDAPGLSVHVVRYEDMQREPLEAFGGAAAFAGLERTPEQIGRAVAFSDFRELRRQEDRGGFRERSRSARRFFRRGEAGSWRDELTPEQVGRVVDDHAAVMRRFGYLVDGEPVVA